MPETPIQIHTYHCLCTTHLLTTPYALSSLPRRAPPALDKAIILPLGSLTSSSDPDPTATDDVMDEEEREREREEVKKERVLPTLLSTALRPARKIVVVRREDGFEKRRVWRCGRCGVGVGYEVVGNVDGEKGRVMFLLEGGLREGDEV